MKGNTTKGKTIKMLKITNNTLYINDSEVQQLPKLHKNATVRVFAVPTDYRENGYYIDIHVEGTIKTYPACDPKSVIFIGQVDYPLDEQTLADYELEQQKQRMRDAVTERRWEVMTGGLTLPNGMRVGTTIDDQNRITSVIANAELTGLTDISVVDFKGTDGWVSVTIADIKNIAGAVGRFVQHCYTTEKNHHTAINSLTDIEEVKMYDITSNWTME